MDVGSVVSVWCNHNQDDYVYGEIVEYTDHGIIILLYGTWKSGGIDMDEGETVFLPWSSIYYINLSGE